MPLAWEYNITYIPGHFPKKVIVVPSHVCGGNPQYSRYYKSCRLCKIRKASFKLQQPNLNQRSVIKNPCINGVGEFTYAVNLGCFRQRPRLYLGLLVI